MTNKLLYIIFFGILACGLTSIVRAQTIVVDCKKNKALCATTNIKIIDKSWNNRTLKNCNFSNERTGFVIRGVTDFTMDSCVIENITKGSGIYFDPKYPSKNVKIENSTLRKIAKNGIAAPENSVSNLTIHDNLFSDIATKKRNGLHHGIYVQVPEATINMNYITRVHDGNGIAIRSSGQIFENYITHTGKSGIGYFNDHPSPELSQLIISNNQIFNYGTQFSKRAGIQLLLSSPKYSPISKVIIKNNNVEGTNPIDCGGHRNCIIK